MKKNTYICSLNHKLFCFFFLAFHSEIEICARCQVFKENKKMTQSERVQLINVEWKHRQYNKSWCSVCRITDKQETERAHAHNRVCLQVINRKPLCALTSHIFLASFFLIVCSTSFAFSLFDVLLFLFFPRETLTQSNT